MKQTLLFLSLFFSIVIYAQTPAVPPPLFACDGNNDGIAVFDLASLIPMLVNGLNPATTVVTFHETIVDAQAGTNAIANPNAYLNIGTGQFIHIRIFDTVTNTVNFSDISLIVNPSPITNPGVLFFCEGLSALAIYNLNQADVQITAGSASAFIAYYETLADAQTQANAIGPGYAPIINPGQQILYASVTNTNGGCRSITTLTLNTNNCDDACPAPINLVASAVNDTSFTLSWSTTGGSGNNMIAVVPQGSNPDSGAFAVVTLMPFVLTGLNPNACYSVYVKTICPPTTSSDWSVPLNICMPNCADSAACSQTLVLNAFLDSNNNGTKDTSEVDFNHGNFVYQVNDSGNIQYGTSNDGSYYIFDSNPTNSYDIGFAVNTGLNAYYSSAVTHNNIALPTGSGSNTLYFPIANPLPHVDAQINISPIGQPRPGFQYTNLITYRNLGSQTIASGMLNYSHQSNVSISSISQPGTTTTANGFTYSFNNLDPFEIRYIQVQLLVPTIPTVNLGDLVTNNATIQISNDIDLSNNSLSLTQTIVGSYDPNDKMEAHGGKIVHSTFTSNDYLYYTIQFENTGTASAEFIRVIDLLDAQLDVNSFEMINASHPVNTRRVGNQLTWHFYNINLPPTSSNPTGSHGFISFRIKPMTDYDIGDVIPNAASIYFDYNPAIVTNTFNTEFVQTMGTATFSAEGISMSPNPTSAWVVITNNNIEKISSITIFDITGKKIYTLSNNTLTTININTSLFSKGLYLVELTSDNNSKTTKKILIE